MIQIIQGLEPAGIGSWSFTRVFAVANSVTDKKDELVNQIMTEYFNLFAEKKWKPIAQQLGVKMKRHPKGV